MYVCILILTRITTIFNTNPVSLRPSARLASTLGGIGLLLRLLVVELVVEVFVLVFNRCGMMRTMVGEIGGK